MNPQRYQLVPAGSDHTSDRHFRYCPNCGSVLPPEEYVLQRHDGDTPGTFYYDLIPVSVIPDTGTIQMPGDEITPS